MTSTAQRETGEVRVSPQAVPTLGIGRKTTLHLNLTRSLADVAAGGSEAMRRAKERTAQRKIIEAGEREWAR